MTVEQRTNQEQGGSAAKPKLFQELEGFGIETIAQSELWQLVSLLYEHMPCCAKVIDEEASLLSMSEVGYGLMEVQDFAPLKGICWLNVWPGSYGEAAKLAFEKAKQEGVAHFEGFAYTTQGSPRWWSVTLLRFEVGGKRLFLSLSQDVTGQRQGQLLEDSDPSFTAPIQQLSDQRVIRIELDAKGKVVKSSPRAEERFELGVGEDLLDRVSAADYDMLSKLLEQQGSHTEIRKLHLRVPKRRNALISLDLQAIYSVEGSFLRWSALLEDLRHRELLRRELEVLYTLTPGMIVLLDAQGQIQHVNPGFERETGLTLNGVQGVPMRELLHPEDRDAFVSLLDRALEGKGQDEAYTLRVRQIEGGHGWFSFMLGGSPTEGFCYAYGMDISDQKALEQGLREVNHALDVHNRHLELLNHLGHHNLQEPIRKISVYTSRLKRHVKRDDQNSPEIEAQHKEIRDGLSQIETITKRMRQQLYALLTYTNIHRHTPDKMAISVKDLLERALHRHGQEHPERKPHELVLELEHELELVGDPDSLGAMFYYLFDNAFKFSKDDEQIVKVRVSARRVEGRHLIVFSDEGVGVAKRHLVRIVEPFQKLHVSKPGEGMGLALCKKIIEQHQGELVLMSDGEGRGFSVAINL